MYLIKPENAASTKITVTGTATALYTLMDTAGSIATSQAYYDGFKANAFIIKPEDGDIRVLPKATPTSTQGLLLKSGSSYSFTGTDLTDFRLIRTSGNVACSVLLGHTEAGESFNAGSDTVSVSLDEFPAAAVLADNTSLPTTTQVGAVLELYDGTNLGLARGGQTSNSTTVTGFQNDLPMARYNASPTARTEGQFGNLQAAADGSLRVNTGTLAQPVIDSYATVAINLAAGANQVLVSSAASKQIWVYGLGFTVNVAGTVSFQDEDDTAITGIMQIAATGGMVSAPSGNLAMPMWKLATDKDLEVDVVTSELDGWLTYAIVSV